MARLAVAATTLLILLMGVVSPREGNLLMAVVSPKEGNRRGGYPVVLLGEEALQDVAAAREIEAEAARPAEASSSRSRQRQSND